MYRLYIRQSERIDELCVKYTQDIIKPVPFSVTFLLKNRACMTLGKVKDELLHGMEQSVLQTQDLQRNTETGGLNMHTIVASLLDLLQELY